MAAAPNLALGVLAAGTFFPEVRVGSDDGNCCLDIARGGVPCTDDAEERGGIDFPCTKEELPQAARAKHLRELTVADNAVSMEQRAVFKALVTDWAEDPHEVVRGSASDGVSPR